MSIVKIKPLSLVSNNMNEVKSPQARRQFTLSNQDSLIFSITAEKYQNDLMSQNKSQNFHQRKQTNLLESASQYNHSQQMISLKKQANQQQDLLNFRQIETEFKETNQKNYFVIHEKIKQLQSKVQNIKTIYYNDDKQTKLEQSGFGQFSMIHLQQNNKENNSFYVNQTFYQNHQKSQKKNNKAGKIQKVFQHYQPQNNIANQYYVYPRSNKMSKSNSIANSYHSTSRNISNLSTTVKNKKSNQTNNYNNNNKSYLHSSSFVKNNSTSKKSSKKSTSKNKSILKNDQNQLNRVIKKNYILQTELKQTKIKLKKAQTVKDKQKTQIQQQKQQIKYLKEIIIQLQSTNRLLNNMQQIQNQNNHLPKLRY